MVIPIAALLGIAAALAEGAPAAPSAGACADLIPPVAAAGEARRALVPEDLVRLRDIGPVDPVPHDARLFTLSPDGRRAAFQMSRADPDANIHCLAMVVVEVRPGATARVVDRGGDLIRVAYDFRGKAAFPTGISRAITPRWSMDGRWIAFLKRERGTTQVWRAQADGSQSIQLTRSAEDVEDFRLGTDGETIVFSTRPDLRQARQEIAREGLSGFHYDDRYAPMSSSRPFPLAPIEAVAWTQSLATGQIRPASKAEAAVLEATSNPGEAVWTVARATGGRLASIQTDGQGLKQGRLSAQGKDGVTLPCPEEACAEASRPWWTGDGRRVRFFGREGWAQGSTAIYEWTPGQSAPRRLYVTDDLLADCEPSGETLLCLREGSLAPRRLERLDPATGRRELVFDPNPEYSSLRLGAVERLHWRNARGLETMGDLVLPVGYRRGTRYPLIVVQYDTRGFLRGGTGDEYPIQAFANRGYAVLSVSRPRPIGDEKGFMDVTKLGRADLEDFADRRSTLSAVEMGVQLLITRGIVDPARVGITGLSDGASTASFALLHSTYFAAAAMSSCCFDTTLPMRVGPAAARHFHGEGYPRLTDDNPSFWKEISLSRNARRIRTPVLLQLSDDEMMSALESFTALREVEAPIDMFIFPGEHHVKWQPAHRLAVYRRAVDWFDYWLLDKRSPDPGRQAELEHWDALKAARGGSPLP